MQYRWSVGKGDDLFEREQSLKLVYNQQKIVGNTSTTIFALFCMLVHFFLFWYISAAQQAVFRGLPLLRTAVPTIIIVNIINDLGMTNCGNDIT